MIGLLSVDQRERRSSSLAKKAAGIFRKSRVLGQDAILTAESPQLLFSSLVRAPSAPLPSSASACRTQFLRADSVKSRSVADRATLPSLPGQPDGACLLLVRERSSLPSGHVDILAHRASVGVSTFPGQGQPTDLRDRTARLERLVESHFSTHCDLVGGTPVLEDRFNRASG